jgi:drug/metabolite transporter (DMT)-like permease
LPVDSGDGDERAHAVTQGIWLALLNACFIAGYTLVDGTGVRLSDTALGYTLWTFFMNGFCLLSWAMVARRREASGYLRLHWKKGLLGGVGTMGSYGLALWAMTQAPLAVVAALRETSILWGADRVCPFKREGCGPAHRGGAGYCRRRHSAAPGVNHWQH